MTLNTANEFTDVMKVFDFTGIVSINNYPDLGPSVKYSIKLPRHFFKFKYKKFYKKYMDFMEFVNRNSTLCILKEFEIY